VAGALGAGAVGVGFGWVAAHSWSMTGLLSWSSAWFLFAQTLWTIAGRPPGSEDLFASRPVFSNVCVCVYYCRTYYKAVRGVGEVFDVSVVYYRT